MAQGDSKEEAGVAGRAVKVPLSALTLVPHEQRV